MAAFMYQARDGKGRSVSGTLEAMDAQSAASVLVDKGLLVLSMQQVSARGRLGRGRGRKIKPTDLEVFTRQLATMMDAGLPLVQSLTALAEETDNHAFKKILHDVTEKVESGFAFSEALAAHPKIFTTLYISMVQAGEASGLLAEILDRVAAYLEAANRLRKKVKSAMAYPVIVSIIALTITTALIIFVIPVFERIYTDFDATLPLPTQILVGISKIFRRYAVFVIAGIVGACLSIRKLRKTEKGSEIWDRMMLRLPVFGKLMHKVALARFSRTFAALVRSGVPILETLKIVARSAGNKLVEYAVGDAVEDVQEGDGLAASLGRSDIFPPMLIRMLSAGEKTGKVEVMLDKVADFYDQEVESTLAALTSLIEPLLIMFLGVVVGGIVICMFLPIFKLHEVVKM